MLTISSLFVPEQDFGQLVDELVLLGSGAGCKGEHHDQGEQERYNLLYLHLSVSFPGPGPGWSYFTSLYFNISVRAFQDLLFSTSLPIK